MIRNTALIALANRYLEFLKIGYITYEQFMNRMQSLIDLMNEDKDKDTFKIRGILILIEQAGEKWK